MSAFEYIHTYVVNVYPDGSEDRMMTGHWSRLDAPCVKLANGHEEWWFNGHKHRIGGPAIILKDGTKQWWIKGIQYNEDEYKKLI